MPLKVMLFTNNEAIAATADACGADRIVVDLEIIGKNERQGHLDTRISAHTLEDVRRIRAVVRKAEFLVRINPIHDATPAEIESVLEAGADILMLPYFNTLEEIQTFLKLVHGRAQTMLLLETARAEALIDDIIALGGFDSIHIGINDLALSKGLSFLFESLLDPSFETLCGKIRAAGIPFGFGGISRLNEGKVATRYIIPEHYRLGSSQVILGRSFLSVQEIEADLDKAKRILIDSLAEIRAYEAEIAGMPASFFSENSRHLHRLISEVAAEIRSRS